MIDEQYMTNCEGVLPESLLLFEVKSNDDLCSEIWIEVIIYDLGSLEFRPRV